MSITVEQLRSFAPNLTVSSIDPYQAIVDAVNAACTKYDISSPRRVRYFMAQTAFECNYYSELEEDLFYSSPDRLVVVWPQHFTMNQSNTTLAYAPDYAKNPQKLGNLIYANRNGNGDVNSGDGYNFRGRGALGLTFKDNYAKCSQDAYGDDRLVQNPDLVAQYTDAVMSAGWFWGTRDLNSLADADDFTKVTDIINGSTVTVPKRILVLNKANVVF